MPLLTPALLQKLRAIVEKHHQAFVVNAFGKTAVAPDILEHLEKLGLIVKNPGTALQDAYLYGQVLAAAENPAMLSWSGDKLARYLEKNPIPLSAAEEGAIQAANLSGAHYCMGLGNTVSKETGQLLIEGDKELRAKLEKDIQDKTAANLAARETVKQLKSAIGWATADWTRDLDRIAITEKHNALTEGTAAAIEKKDGEDAWVFFRTQPGACPQCLKLHNGPDGHPRFFKLSQLPAAGANVKKPQAQWVVSRGAVHPRCQCIMLRRPAGWGFNAEGQLTPAGEFGTEAGDGEEFQKALEAEDLHQARLEKARSEIPAAELGAFVEADNAGLLDMTGWTKEAVWEGCCRAVLKEVAKDPGIPFHRLTDRVSAGYGEDLGGRVALALADTGALRKEGDRYFPRLEKGRRLAGRLDFQGLKVSLEHQAGDTRHWYDPHAKEHGQTTMKVPYGYIRGTEGVDGDQHDVFIGPDPNARFAYVVHARKKVGKDRFGGLDEQKTMLGFSSAAAAREAYLQHYNDGRFFGGMDAIPMEDFKQQVLERRHGKTARGLPVAFPEHQDGPRLFIPLEKAQGGPFMGPKGGKWADAQHTVPWHENPGSREHTQALVQHLRDTHGVQLDVAHAGPSLLELDRIVVPKEKRGTGTGTKVMETLHRYADMHGKRVALTPSSDFGGSKTRLEGFYRGFGYVPNKGRHKDFETRQTMIRQPQSLQKAERPGTPLPGTGVPLAAWEGARVVEADGAVHHGGAVNIVTQAAPRPIGARPDPTGLDAWLKEAMPRTVVVKRDPKIWEMDAPKRHTIPVDLSVGVLATNHDLLEAAEGNKQRLERFMLQDNMAPRNLANPGWTPPLMVPGWGPPGASPSESPAASEGPGEPSGKVGMDATSVHFSPPGGKEKRTKPARTPVKFKKDADLSARPESGKELEPAPPGQLLEPPGELPAGPGDLPAIKDVNEADQYAVEDDNLEKGALIHKYLHKEGWTGHWVYTYAKTHKAGAQLAPHAEDPDKAALVMPKTPGNLAELQALASTHGLAPPVERPHHVILPFTRKQSEAMTAHYAAPPAPIPAPALAALHHPEPKPVAEAAKELLAALPAAKPKPAKKKPEPFSGLATHAEATATMPAVSAPKPNPKGGWMMNPGQAVTVGGKDATLKGWDWQGRAFLTNGETVTWDQVKAAGPRAPVKSAAAGLKDGAVRQATNLQVGLVAKVLAKNLSTGKTAEDYADWLHAKGHDVYLVGGIVRDLIAGTAKGKDPDAIVKDMTDVDFVSAAPPSALKACHDALNPGASANSNTYCQQKGFIPSPNTVDLASLAKGLHSEQPAFDHDMEGDAARRDFTANALYYDVHNHVVVDPTGQGIMDATNKVLRRLPGPEWQQDDRMPVRFWKFRTRGWTGDGETTKAIVKLAEKHFPGMGVPKLVELFGKQFGKGHESPAKLWADLETAMKEDGASHIWKKHVEPIKSLILQAIKENQAKH